MGEGVVKNPEKLPTLFMDGPLQNDNLTQSKAFNVHIS